MEGSWFSQLFYLEGQENKSAVCCFRLLLFDNFGLTKLQAHYMAFHRRFRIAPRSGVLRGKATASKCPGIRIWKPYSSNHLLVFLARLGFQD